MKDRTDERLLENLIASQEGAGSGWGPMRLMRFNIKPIVQELWRRGLIPDAGPYHRPQKLLRIEDASHDLVVQIREAYIDEPKDD